MPDSSSAEVSNPVDSLVSAQQKTLSRGNTTTVALCPPNQEEHWIEIKLQDENGDPVPNESYVITGPNGEEYTGSLDENGFVRIDGLNPGECAVTFPRLAERYAPDLVSGNLPAQS